MSRTYKKNRVCSCCGKKITDDNKSGYCGLHINRTGANNNFFGKKHSKETIEKIKEKTKEASKKLWTNEDYKKKVIMGISKPRKNSFKIEQSERIKNWYIENHEQKTIRSEKMKNSWLTGKIVSGKKFSCNRSMQEKEIFYQLQRVFSEDFVSQRTIKHEGCWFFPDITIFNKIIIEFYGDYWHANPLFYKKTDVINGIKAEEIWDRDKKRLDIFNNLGFYTIIVWESAFKKNKNNILKNLILDLNFSNFEDIQNEYNTQ